MLRTAALLVLCIEAALGGKVKQALFGALFGDSHHNKIKLDHKHGHGLDEDQMALAEWFKLHGYSQYASKEFITKLDEVIAYDSIEDLTHLVADNEYGEVDIPEDDALKIQNLARREMLKVFLARVPVPNGAPSDLYSKHLDPLIQAGYDEPDDVADLDEDEATEMMGLKPEHTQILVTYAEEYEARELLHIIVMTHVDKKTDKTYYTSDMAEPIIETLVKAGVRSLTDLALLSHDTVPALAKEDLVRLQADPRVVKYMHKQEL